MRPTLHHQLATFALLRLDGQWVDPDNISDFVTVPPGETPDDACYRYQRQYLSALPGDVIIVRYEGARGATTESLVTRSRSGTVRRIFARHDRQKLRALVGERLG